VALLTDFHFVKRNPTHAQRVFSLFYLIRKTISAHCSLLSTQEQAD
jgi:hypothetical protein